MYSLFLHILATFPTHCTSPHFTLLTILDDLCKSQISSSGNIVNFVVIPAFQFQIFVLSTCNGQNDAKQASKLIGESTENIYDCLNCAESQDNDYRPMTNYMTTGFSLIHSLMALQPFVGPWPLL
jgi:hypothetical protein